MAKFKKGQSGNPTGKPKGTANKSTAKAREAIAMRVDENAYKMMAWLEEIAAENPTEAFKLLTSVIEYHIPKLSRAEQQHLDKDGKPTDNKLIVEIVDPDGK